MKKFESLIKNLLLNLLLFLKHNPDTGKEPSFDKNSRIIFIRLNRIGDALVSTPLLHFIKQELGCRIYILADQKNHFIFRNSPDIDEVIVFKKGINAFKDFIRILKTEKIDTIVDLHDDVSTTVSFLITLGSAANKFGLEKGNKKLYTRTVTRPNPTKTHIVSRIMQIAKLFNLNPDRAEICIKYYPKSEEMDKAGKFISKNFTRSKPIIGVNISAGSEARFWGNDRYKQLINFLSSYGVEILIIAAPKDKALIELIGFLKYFISESYDEFASIISKLRLLFSPDTAAIHIASFYRVPVFGMFVHDTEDMIWSPLNIDFDYVETKEHNFENLQFDEVIKKFKPFLEKHIQ